MADYLRIQLFQSHPAVTFASVSSPKHPRVLHNEIRTLNPLRMHIKEPTRDKDLLILPLLYNLALIPSQAAHQAIPVIEPSNALFTFLFGEFLDYRLTFCLAFRGGAVECEGLEQGVLEEVAAFSGFLRLGLLAFGCGVGVGVLA